MRDYHEAQVIREGLAGLVREEIDQEHTRD